MAEPLLIRYMQPLIAGRRAECFELIQSALETQRAETLLCDIVWPAMAQVERLFTDDRINTAVAQMANRINRTVADQLQAHLPSMARVGKRAIIVSAALDAEELGAQMTADLLQARGWEVYFPGGGVPHDELLGLVGQLRPHVLIILGTEAELVPEARQLVEMIRDIGVCPTMNIIASGGIYNRADGLWQEVGADVHANDARELLEMIDDLAPREPGTQRVAVVKRRRRKRKAAPVA